MRDIPCLLPISAINQIFELHFGRNVVNNVTSYSAIFVWNFFSVMNPAVRLANIPIVVTTEPQKYKDE